jgi:N utilization substance protein B
MQGFYQWRVAGGAAEVIEAQLRDGKEFAKTDQDFFSDLLRGGLAKSAELEQQIQTCLDRPLKELSPVEFAILLLGAYELSDHLETPYRVVINEAVELAKTYGGSDGHKYVNGVLDKLAARMRSPEVNTAN